MSLPQPRAPTADLVEQEQEILKLHRNRENGEVSIGAIADRVLKNIKIVEDGTDAAIRLSHLSVAANSSSSPTRGGARNSGARESYMLKRPQIENLIAAAHFACEISLPLNRMITVHWEESGISLEEMPSASGRFIDLLSKAIARHGGKTSWVWVHEGGNRKGGHCHMLVPVPPNLVPKITRQTRRWLKRITGNPYRRNVIKSRPIGGWVGAELKAPALYTINLWAALSYVVKGTSPQVAKDLVLSRREEGGKVIGRRCSTSQNIGRGARKQRR